MDESMDTSVDTSVDTAPDTSVDTAPDTSDTGSDTAADTSDAGFDAPEDVPEDVPEDTSDVSFDAPEDVPEDIPEDVPADEPADMPEEVYADEPEDVPEDMPEDESDWDAEEEEGPELVLKRDEMELLNSGNAAIEQRLEAQADNYRDQGLSESEIASRLESDRRDFQQEFLQDAFPGQDVSPDVFNGFSNPDVSGLARYPEGEGPADMAAPDVPDTPEAPGPDWQDTAGDVPVTGFDSADTSADVPEDVPEDIPEAAPGDVPEGFFDGLEQDTPEDIPEDVPEDIPEDAPGDVPEGFFDGLEQDTPEDIPEDVPEDTPADMPEDVPGDEPEADDGVYHAVPNAELVDSSGGADGEDADLLETDGGADAAEHADSDVPISADVRTVDDVNGWLGDINPNYDAFDPESPYCSNCGSCAYAVYQRLEGSTDSCASAENIGYNKDMEALTGMKQVPMSPSEIEQRLLDQGDGAHAIIGIDRAEGPGHWFNAACIDGKVVAIDGQSGEIMDWPPDYGNVVNWEMSIKQ